MSSEAEERPRRSSRAQTRLVSTHDERPRGGPSELDDGEEESTAQEL